MYSHEGCTCSRTYKQQPSLGMLTLSLGLIERLERALVLYTVVESLAFPLYVQRFTVD